MGLAKYIAYIFFLSSSSYLFGQENSSYNVNEHYANGEYRMAIDYIFSLDSIEQRKPQIIEKTAKCYFAIGQTDLAEHYTILAMDNWFSKLKIKWLLLVFEKKYKFEKDKKKLNYWRKIIKQFFPNGLPRNCSADGRKEMYRLIFAHYESEGNNVGIAYFQNEKKNN